MYAFDLRILVILLFPCYTLLTSNSEPLWRVIPFIVLLYNRVHLVEFIVVVPWFRFHIYLAVPFYIQKVDFYRVYIDI